MISQVASCKLLSYPICPFLSVDEPADDNQHLNMLVIISIRTG